MDTVNMDPVRLTAWTRSWQVRLRSKHEQMAQLLRRARNVAEVRGVLHMKPHVSGFFHLFLFLRPIL